MADQSKPPHELQACKDEEGSQKSGGINRTKDKSPSFRMERREKSDKRSMSVWDYDDSLDQKERELEESAKRMNKYKKLPFIGVQNIAFQIWKKFGIQKVMSNEQGFYFFKFSQADAARRVIDAGPWYFGSKLLILKQWYPQMQLVKEQMARVPIWAQFYNVPLVLWNEGGLSHLASAIGVPLYADDLTENRRRLSYAKICVEVEVCSELPDSVDVECMGEQVTVGVKYPWKPVKCLECHLFVHNAYHCGSKFQGAKPQKFVWVVKSTKGVSATDSKGLQPAENGSSSAPIPGIVACIAPAADISVGKEVVLMDDLVSTPLASPRAPPVGVGQSPVLKGSNSFSALALINQEDSRIEEGVDELLDLFEHPTSVLDPELDVPFVLVAKKTRGRGNAKAVLPGVLHNAVHGSVARMVLARDPQIFQVDLIFSSPQLIVVKILTVDQRLFYVSCIYGHNSMVDGRRLWEDMRTLAPTIGDTPWLQFGDFNVVRRSSERLEGFDNVASLEFNTCLDDINMDDMPFKGLWFTWSNKRGGQGNVKSKLDRALINGSWLDIFPELETIFLAPGISDHCFILVNVLLYTPRRSPFKFFNFWMRHDQFKEELRKSWSLPVTGSIKFKLYEQLSRLKPVLREFNKKFFSQISERVVKAREELFALIVLRF
ncbi:hypothetical protein RHMOL_Rhmol02G0082600 [Rhododendron molle]|uniref:Uncharacterized protein n=1 Tax=Rhododendron molle TaxID=49168 RepID=A0ACC0PN72_RHOML|nr:hypothetical protein RHMOL_Rhmol02G0082600 [Rhododendron molle]